MSESQERPLFESDTPLPATDSYDTANLTGRQIGRYLIGRRLGSGGAAAVYQSYDQVQGRSVALKVLLPGADETIRSRFRQEARTAGALRHPNIVTTLQVGDAPGDGIAYIAMELIEGESLARLLEQRGHLQPEESGNLLTPIARALAHAHRAGVIHRDVKPSNILLRPASPGAPGSVQLEALDHPVVPLLSDFGIARALDMPELTNAGRTIGTPAYMAPEQCAGSREVNAQSDIYSLGAVLYRCLVGRAPFLGATTQILYAHVYESVTIPDDILATLPPRVVDVLRVTLAKEPSERYADALALADALTLAAGRSLAAPDAGEVEATSTLTLSSISPVRQAPPPQRTETVIVASPALSASSSGQSQKASSLSNAPASDFPARDLSTVAQPLRPPVARPISAPLPVSTQKQVNRWPRLVAGAAGILALLLIGVVLISAGSTLPFGWLSSQSNGITPTSQAVVLRATAPQSAVVAQATATPDTPPAPTQQTPSPTPAAPTALPTERPTLAAPTATPQPTQTPVQEPTEVPTTASTAVPPQPTATPPETVPVEEGLAVACQYVPVEELYNYLLQPGNAEALGCATDQGKSVDFEVQPFQNGLMLRREDTREIYVRFAGNGQWERHPDRWTPEMPLQPLDPDLNPPSPGLVLPERGIGLLWAENSQLRDALGWATAPATPTSGIVQTFDRGLLIRDGEAEGEVIYAFLKSLFRF